MPACSSSCAGDRRGQPRGHQALDELAAWQGATSHIVDQFMDGMFLHGVSCPGGVEGPDPARCYRLPLGSPSGSPRVGGWAGKQGLCHGRADPRPRCDTGGHDIRRPSRARPAHPCGRHAGQPAGAGLAAFRLSHAGRLRRRPSRSGAARRRRQLHRHAVPPGRRPRRAAAGRPVPAHLPRPPTATPPTSTRRCWTRPGPARSWTAASRASASRCCGAR